MEVNEGSIPKSYVEKTYKPLNPSIPEPIERKLDNPTVFRDLKQSVDATPYKSFYNPVQEYNDKIFYDTNDLLFGIN
jgi:hypothetical protein